MPISCKFRSQHAITKAERLEPDMKRGNTATPRGMSGSKLPVLGATGKSGRPVVEQALEAGHTVTTKGSIDRVDAADCLLAVLDDRATVRQAFLVAGR